jgi:hypothetical protein
MMNRSKMNWILDVTLFAGFLVACWLDLTGVDMHQWLGMAVGIMGNFHLLAHRSWVKSMTTKFFKNLTTQARTYYLLDLGLFLGFSTILVSGLYISTWFALPGAVNPAWKQLHIVTSVVTLMLLITKIALHWRWIVGVAKRHIFGPVTMVGNLQPPVLAPAYATYSRREFLKFMGVVGAVSLIPFVNVLSAAAQTQPIVTSASASQTSVATPAQVAKSGSSAQTTASNSCTVRCTKGCSYPGRCRRYTDSNKNNRCDLGECT